MQKPLAVCRHLYPYFRPHFRFTGDGESVSTNCRTVLTMLYYRHDYCTEIAGWHTEF